MHVLIYPLNTNHKEDQDLWLGLCRLPQNHSILAVLWAILTNNATLRYHSTLTTYHLIGITI